jgi:undecaprenyl-diphosphatase
MVAPPVFGHSSSNPILWDGGAPSCARRGRLRPRARRCTTTSRTRWPAAALTRVVLPFALLTALTIGLGLLVTHVLVHVWPFTVEDEAVRALVAVRTPTLNRISNLMSLSGYIACLSVVLIVAGGAMRLAFHRWREALFLAAALLAQLGVYEITARVVARARPPVVQLDDFPPMLSFFSGHSAAAVALYGGVALVLALHARRRVHAAAWWIALLIVPVAVAISRVYRGMHYPSDVATSFLVGLGCLWILQRAILAPDRWRGSSAA